MMDVMCADLSVAASSPAIKTKSSVLTRSCRALPKRSAVAQSATNQPF